MERDGWFWNRLIIGFMTIQVADDMDDVGIRVYERELTHRNAENELKGAVFTCRSSLKPQLLKAEFKRADKFILHEALELYNFKLDEGGGVDASMELQSSNN